MMTDMKINSVKSLISVPTPARARQHLDEAAARNPGPWVEHSKNVAFAAQTLGSRLANIDADVAFSMGMLHDIGRREGRTFLRHVVDGYHYLSELGHERAARICLTHSFPVKRIQVASAKCDLNPVEVEFIEDYLASIEYDGYDRLIQLCDGISTAAGYCLLEKRMVAVGLRHGVNEHTVEKWRARFRIKEEIEQELGTSIYRYLVGVVEGTFGFDPHDG
jgi:hypothetical protein